MLSANKETKFPEPFGYKDWELQASQVDSWVNSCMDDWEPLPTVWDYYVEYHRLLDWRNKWFKQFTEKKE